MPRDDTPEAAVLQTLDTLKHLAGNNSQARLWVLTREVHEGTNLVHAPLWGMARVAAAEHPQLWGGVVDVAGALPLGVLASLAGHGVVVVRDGVATTARLADARPGAGTPMTCSPAGTYLVTGGTGVLGLRIAHRLADLGARRLVLLSRSGIPTPWAVGRNADRGDPCGVRAGGARSLGARRGDRHRGRGCG